MREDRLARHSKVENRERHDAFDIKLSENCTRAVSHDKLRRLPEEKKKIIERLTEK